MLRAEFHALYERHARDVFRFALYLSGERAQAEDLASETFLRAWVATERIRTETVKGYLFSIVRNLVRERYRERAPVSELSEDMQDKRPGPSREAHDRVELDAVLRALQQLPEVDRAALLMSAQDGMAHEEIARALGLSVAAVKVRIHRARLKLGELKVRQERLA